MRRRTRELMARRSGAGTSGRTPPLKTTDAELVSPRSGPHARAHRRVSASRKLRRRSARCSTEPSRNALPQTPVSMTRQPLLAASRVTPGADGFLEHGPEMLGVPGVARVADFGRGLG